MQQAVENVTGICCSSRKHNVTHTYAMPLSSNPDIIPDIKPLVTRKSAAPQVIPTATGTDKELTVTISSSDVKKCKPQVARRGVPFLGPNRQTDRNTLAEMKKIDSLEPESKAKNKAEVIEDCQVPVDYTSYADWLLEQGIAVNKEGEAIIAIENSDPNPVCKIHQEPGMDEAKEKDHNVEPSNIQLDSKMVVNEEDLKSTEYKIEDTDEKPNLEKGKINNKKPEATHLKPDIKGEIKEEKIKVDKTDGAEGGFEPKEIVSEYIQKFEGDLCVAIYMWI